MSDYLIVLGYGVCLLAGVIAIWRDEMGYGESGGEIGTTAVGGAPRVAGAPRGSWMKKCVEVRG